MSGMEVTVPSVPITGVLFQELETKTNVHIFSMTKQYHFIEHLLYARPCAEFSPGHPHADIIR